jgi:hypothetical protein
MVESSLIRSVKINSRLVRSEASPPQENETNEQGAPHCSYRVAHNSQQSKCVVQVKILSYVALARYYYSATPIILRLALDLNPGIEELIV